MKRMHVKLTFIEPVLGTWPSNQNIAREFIASKSPDAASIEDEVAAIGADAVADKGMTVFPRDPDGNPIFTITKSKECLRMLAVCFPASAARPRPARRRP